MNPFNLIPMMVEERHAAMRKEADQHRRLSEAFPTRNNRSPLFARFLAWVGKELASLGSSLEERYGGQAEVGMVMSPQGNAGDCTG